MTRLRAWPARHDKALIGVAVVILVVLALYLIIALSSVTGRQDRVDDALKRAEVAEQVRTEQRDALAAAESLRTKERNALAADVNDLRLQFERCKDKPVGAPGCTAPVAPPPGVTVRAITGPPGVPGPIGTPGLPGSPGRDGAPVSAAQVSLAVGKFCALGQCARPPTPAQVASAVTAHCADGACDGKPGKDGTDGVAGQGGLDGRPGAPGVDSVIPGPLGPVGNPGANGPGPTPGQVATAVADYCATRGNCTGLTGPQGPPGADSTVPGPQGPAGVDGAPGATGRGITSVTCADQRPTVLTFTFTDGTTGAVTCTPPP